MPPFARQDVGGARAKRLHHKRLIEGFASVRHPRQAIGPGKFPRGGFVDRFRGIGRHEGNQRRHLGVGDAHPSVQHGIQHPFKRGRRPQLKRSRRRGRQHHGHNIALPTGAFNQQEPLVVQQRSSQVHNGLRLRNKIVGALERRLHQHQTVAVQVRSRVSIELNKLTHIGACDQIQLIDDHVLGLSLNQSHPCNRCCTPQSGEQGNQFSFHGVRCEWTSKVAYLSCSTDEAEHLSSLQAG